MQNQASASGDRSDKARSGLGWQSKTTEKEGIALEPGDSMGFHQDIRDIGWDAISWDDVNHGFYDLAALYG